MASNEALPNYLNLPYFDKPELNLKGSPQISFANSSGASQVFGGGTSGAFAFFFVKYNLMPHRVEGKDDFEPTFLEAASQGGEAGKFWDKAIVPLLNKINEGLEIKMSTDPKAIFEAYQGGGLRTGEDPETFQITTSNKRIPNFVKNGPLGQILKDEKVIKFFEPERGRLRNLDLEEFNQFLEEVKEFLVDIPEVKENQITDFQNELQNEFTRKSDNTRDATRRRKQLKLVIPDVELLDGETEDFHLYLELSNIPDKTKMRLNRDPKALLGLYQNNRQMFNKFVYPDDEELRRLTLMFLQLADISGKGFEPQRPGSLSQGFTSIRGIRDKNLKDPQTPFSKARNTLEFERTPSPLKYLSTLIEKYDEGAQFSDAFYVENPQQPAILKGEVFKYSAEETKELGKEKQGNITIGKKSLDFRREIAKYEKFDDYWLDGRLALLLDKAERGELKPKQKKIISQFIGINPQTQKIERRTSKGGNNRNAFGFTYEHLTPVSVLRKLAEFVSNQRVALGQDEKIDNDIKEILEKLHKIVLLGKYDDQGVGKVNQFVMRTSLEKKIGVKDTGKDNPLEYYKTLPEENRNPDYVMKQIKGLTEEEVFGRYTEINISMPVPLKKYVQSPSDEIELQGITRGDLAIDRNEIFENKTSLYEILFNRGI